MAFLTVMGMYNYDNTIFDNMVFPEGMDGGLLKNAIILDTAELEVVYPEPQFFKTALNLWSHTRLETWQRIYNASVAEYNPIENYNRYEEESSGLTRQHSGSDTTSATRQHSGTDQTSESVNGSAVTDGEVQRTISGTDAGTVTENHVTTNDIAAFDSNTLATHDKSTQTANDSNSVTRSGTETTTDDTTVTNSETRSGSVTHGEQITDSSNLTHGEKITDQGARESHIHGNIGVTTSQQMLESELMISEKLNVYDYIVKDFKMRFCVLVY